MSAVIEIDGMQWKPVDGATATAQEFAAARALFIEVLRESSWNPWVEEDRADELQAAIAVMDQWTRAEPGFRHKTKEEIDARLARLDEEFDKEWAERDRQRKARIPLYDEQRHEARLALLEQQSVLDHATRERDGLAAKTVFPGMDDRRRTDEIATLDAKVTETEERVAVLRVQVGDSETVVDRLGWLPADRRESNLTRFALWRESKVRELREKITQLEAAAKAASDRAEARDLRSKLGWAQRTCDAWMAIPRLEAADMCADCREPAAWHMWSISGTMGLLGAGPCPAWPKWGARVRSALEILMAASDARSVPPPEPKPQPLAVIPSGLPIDEVLARLTNVRAEHPQAKVQRGNRNRWEIWPS